MLLKLRKTISNWIYPVKTPDMLDLQLTYIQMLQDNLMSCYSSMGAMIQPIIEMSKTLEMEVAIRKSTTTS